MALLVEVIENHLQREEYAEALPLLRELEQIDPSPVVRSCIIKCMTEESVRDGLPEMAIAFSEDGHVQSENDLIIVFDALQICDRHQEAEDCVNRYLESHPLTESLREIQMQLSFYLDRVDKFLEQYGESKACNQASWVSHAAAATVLVKLGRYDAALEALTKTPETYGAFANNLYFGDAFTEAIRQGTDIVEEHAERIVFSEGSTFSGDTEGERCLFVSGDTGYIERYLGDFLKSYAESGTDAFVHVHALLRSHVEEGAFCEMMKMLSGLRLSFSYELIDDSRDAREYFSTARFLALSALYEKFQFRGSAYALDIDSEIRKDLGPVFDYFQGEHADVGLRLRNSLFLEQRVAAGAMYLSGSEAARAYIADVAKYIAYGIYADTAYWYLDQLAMFETYSQYQKNFPGNVFASIPPAFLDWEFSDDSFVWTTKGGKEGAG